MVGTSWNPSAYRPTAAVYLNFYPTLFICLYPNVPFLMRTPAVVGKGPPTLIGPPFSVLYPGELGLHHALLRDTRAMRNAQERFRGTAKLGCCPFSRKALVLNLPWPQLEGFPARLDERWRLRLAGAGRVGGAVSSASAVLLRNASGIWEESFQRLKAVFKKTLISSLTSF